VLKKIKNFFWRGGLSCATSAGGGGGCGAKLFNNYRLAGLVSLPMNLLV